MTVRVIKARKSYKKFVFTIIVAILVLLVFLSLLIILQPGREKYNEYLTQVSFFESYLKEYYQFEEEVIRDFTDAFMMLYEEYTYITELVLPIELLAIGIVETNFKNVKGDKGESLGYFQIQAPTYWYMKNKYPEIYEKLNFTHAWYWDNVKVRPDVQLITATLYLYDLKIRYGETEAYSLYNGISKAYQDKVNYTKSWLKVKFEEYKEAQKELSK
ncbi:hypothetical protein [Petrotoga sp. 9PWA.NaAc.5.4]|uniref:hypothetical protein n=1 Tax=Petrotoga sp. 9PWA.NaAc.5.4 TaxID=1434328 RepID=UPI000CC55762|nr:hypothetical protein [Petrotoga sp. 9PWA.NaAc.5.4]PNR95394.1 hypothetical protein X924_04810 [Petrotoga sp. 9PWA.NaAc.5.4]